MSTTSTARLAYARPRVSDWSDKILPLRRQAEVRDGWLRERLQRAARGDAARGDRPVDRRRARVQRGSGADEPAAGDDDVGAAPDDPGVPRPADGSFEAMAIANAGIGLDGFYQPMWAKTRTEQAAETQWACLRRVVAERDPRRIGVNVAEHSRSATASRSTSTTR
jgi:hypothetical protein